QQNHAAIKRPWPPARRKGFIDNKPCRAQPVAESKQGDASPSSVWVASDNTPKDPTELANSWAETLPGFGLRGPRLVSTPAAQFSVYPNPSSGLFEVQTVQLADEILISDVIGREVRRVVPISTATSMNLSNQPHGVYFVQVRTGNNVETKRLVIR
ncbi:MAG: T9SS type A sorting domain-containing protein, partial [Bacteroidota bacterium]